MKTTFAILALCALAGASLKAQCGASMKPKVPIARPRVDLALPSALATGSQTLAGQDQTLAPLVQDSAIVGLWRITFTSGGQVVDEGFDLWHSDGTEVLNDNPPPATGNVCVGVWVQTGARSFKLKHLSWSFDMNGIQNGIVIIREQVTVDAAGASFKGAFTVDGFDIAGNPQFHLDGELVGERITVDNF